MELTKLLNGVRVTKIFSLSSGRMVLTQDVTIHAVQYDSRKVERGDVFVAIRGTAVDGHRFIESAVRNGATVVVVEDDTAMPDAFFMHSGVIKVVVPDARLSLAAMAANFYGHPARQLTLVGVTGTNGKTTTTHLIKSVLERQGATVGLIGTIEYSIGNKVIPATHTTPESLELNGLLSSMHEEGCTAAVMEVSSHSLALHRVHGLEFKAGVFTNLTQDHLDFHRTMADYAKAKRILFDSLSPEATAVTNADDPYGRSMIEGIAARTVTYGMKPGALVSASGVSMTMSGMTLSVLHDGKATSVASSLTGRFNVANVLASFAAGVALGVPDSAIAEGIAQVKAVRGRFEQIRSPAGWTAIVDYAHTPDALQNCLQTIREIVSTGGSSRVITVFGCGGNRDRGKRPIMGRIASEMSDITVVTSDNPRHEDPEAILREVLAGVPAGKRVLSVADRHEAIREALGMARPGDVVLLAGKGHENYQVVGDSRVHFDDREEVEEFIGKVQ